MFKKIALILSLREDVYKAIREEANSKKVTIPELIQEIVTNWVEEREVEEEEINEFISRLNEEISEIIKRLELDE